MTSGWSQSQARPHSAGVRSAPAEAQSLGRARDRPGEGAAPERLHDHDPEQAVGRVPDGLDPALVVDVHVVVLDLGEGPVVRVHDRGEGRKVVVEREARVPDAAVGERVVEELEDAEPLQPLPARAVQAVEEVEVDDVGPEPAPLLVEVPVHVGPGLDQPARELGREPDPLAVPVPERLAEERLALALVVDVGRVHVVDAGVDRVPHHRRRRSPVDPAVRRFGQAHGAESQDRERGLDPAHPPVLHQPPRSAFSASPADHARPRSGPRER